jgi:hypothetical protein
MQFYTVFTMFLAHVRTPAKGINAKPSDFHRVFTRILHLCFLHVFANVFSAARLQAKPFIFLRVFTSFWT